MSTEETETHPIAASADGATAPSEPAVDALSHDAATDASVTEPHSEAVPSPAAAPGDAATPARKRRRRRRKKAAPAEGVSTSAPTDGDAADASDEASEGEQATATEVGESKKKKKRRGKGAALANRERPAFRVGEEVFGKVSRVTDDAVWVDIAGKATGLFDLRELTAMASEVSDVSPSEELAAVSPEAATILEAPPSIEDAPTLVETSDEPSALAVDEAEQAGAGASEAGEVVADAADAHGAEVESPAVMPPEIAALRATPDGELPIIGDQFIATVASVGIRGGMAMLSRTPANLEESRKKLEAAAQSGETVEGFVTGAIKGGLEVDFRGLRAFAPASHMDLQHGADLTPWLGRRLDFHVAQYAKKGRDVVVSRKKMLEADSRRTRKAALKAIVAGEVHTGIVRSVMAWGAFVALPDAAGVEGLVHMTEASHDRGAKLVDLFKVGEKIEVKVLRVDEKNKLWLSRKALLSDPWESVRQKYALGSRHRGKVARIQPFGAFVELEAAVDGLIHTADLSLKEIESPEDVVKVGDEIDDVVASLDAGAHKIGLHPALAAAEADEPRQKIVVHKPIQVAVVQAMEQGLLVRVLGMTGRQARGFVPAAQTGTQRGTDLRKEFPVGTKLEAKVLEIDPRRGEAKLSIRALRDDREKQAYQSYRAGVAREAKFGTFADLMKKSQS